LAVTAVGMSRLIATVGALGVVASVWVAIGGYRVAGGGEELVRHAAGGLIASLLALFAQAWFAVFLASSLRVPGALSRPLVVEQSRLRRAALLVAGSASLAVLVTMAAFGSGLLTYAREVAPAWHAALAFGSIATQVVALGIGLRGVLDAERALGAVEAAWNAGRPEETRGDT
jgi:hypothetical protein